MIAIVVVLVIYLSTKNNNMNSSIDDTSIEDEEIIAPEAIIDQTIIDNLLEIETTTDVNGEEVEE